MSKKSGYCPNCGIFYTISKKSLNKQCICECGTRVHGEDGQPVKGMIVEERMEKEASEHEDDRRIFELKVSMQRSEEERIGRRNHYRYLEAKRDSEYGFG